MIRRQLVHLINLNYMVLTPNSGTMPIYIIYRHWRYIIGVILHALGMFSFSCTKERKNEVSFSMAIGNGELMHLCFPKHSRVGTATMK